MMEASEQFKNLISILWGYSDSVILNPNGAGIALQSRRNPDSWIGFATVFDRVSNQVSEKLHQQRFGCPDCGKIAMLDFRPGFQHHLLLLLDCFSHYQVRVDGTE